MVDPAVTLAGMSNDSLAMTDGPPVFGCGPCGFNVETQDMNLFHLWEVERLAKKDMLIHELVCIMSP